MSSRTDKKPSEKRLKRLETMSAQVALTIENARLYEMEVENAASLEIKVRERNAELEKANVRLKELNRLKSLFIASISHELRTPLNSIIGFIGMTLKGMSGDLNEEQRDNLSRSYKAAIHLLALISDVIDISKIETGRVEVFIEDFFLTKVIDEVAASLRPQIEEKGLALEVMIQEPIQMHTDRNRLTQCLTNLLSNAVKYTEKGEIHVTAKVIGEEVELSVIDTGIGIEEENLHRLFESFERIQSHISVKAGGTGLGLYLTKKLATQQLLGSVSVQSEAGKGSTFSLKLPIDLQLLKKAEIQ
ncbi:hypothetical protein H8E50_02580 [bacterium]|nr:hypothetical protein [bacterium]